MLESYWELLIYDFPTALPVSLALALVGGASALFILRFFRRKWPLYVLLGLCGLCFGYAFFALYARGGLSGGIIALSVLFFGLPILAGLLLGWLLHTLGPQFQRHKLLTLLAAGALILLLFWARPRFLWQTEWWDRHGVNYDPAYPSDLGLALTTEDGGETWQLAAIRDWKQVSQAVSTLRCGPVLPMPFGLPGDLPDRQLLFPISYDYVLLATEYGPAYLCSYYIPWQDFSYCSHLETFSFQPSSGNRVLHYPALYDEIIIWLTDSE